MRARKAAIRALVRLTRLQRRCARATGALAARLARGLPPARIRDLLPTVRTTRRPIAYTRRP